MAIVKQGGFSPNQGKVSTTMGLRDRRPPVCTICRERKEGQLYTLSANGQIICGDCSGSVGDGVLRDSCDPENCACGKSENAEPDPA